MTMTENTKKSIVSHIPLYNLYLLYKKKKKYTDMLKAIEVMLTTDGWSTIQSNFRNDDIIYDPENHFIYINTGIQYVPSLNPNFVSLDWVQKWGDYIKPFQNCLAIDTIVPQVSNDKDIATWHIWLHPDTSIEDEYITQSVDTIKSNSIFATIGAGLAFLIYYLLS